MNLSGRRSKCLPLTHAVVASVAPLRRLLPPRAPRQVLLGERFIEHKDEALAGLQGVWAVKWQTAELRARGHAEVA